jgi:iron complex transport system substrate-binding protein
VLCVVGREPLYAAGPGSYFDELVTAAGGENILADARSPFALASIEVVLARAPEVVLESADNRPGTPRGRAPGAWAAWPFLPAVREDRVYLLDPSRFSVPGPRLAEMAEAFARMIHPELFGAPTAADFAPLGAGLASHGGG